MSFFIFIFAAMQKIVPGQIWKWVKIILAIYVACGIALYFLQDKFLFHPQKLSADHPFNFSIPFNEISLPVTDEKNLSIVQFTVPDSTCRGIVLYFHGNRKNIERYAPFAANFTRNNYEVWMIDYPGFGKSTGKRTEDIIYDDAMQFYKMASARMSKDSIIIYGKSIGTGVASYLASFNDCKRLVLETPYYSIENLYKHYAFMYPVRWMARYEFPSYRYVETVAAPITIFHGTDDNIIPYSNASKLLKRSNAATELVTIQHGSHNNLNDFSLFHQKLDSLLQLP